MRPLDDDARFRLGDVNAVIAASFACPMCLHRAAWLVLYEEGSAAAARCRCVMCKLDWTVALDSQQYLRLALSPPDGMMVLRDCSVVGRYGLARARPSDTDG
jgi:hypothetical protein